MPAASSAARSRSSTSSASCSEAIAAARSAEPLGRRDVRRRVLQVARGVGGLGPDARRLDLIAATSSPAISSEAMPSSCRVVAEDLKRRSRRAASSVPSTRAPAARPFRGRPRQRLAPSSRARSAATAAATRARSGSNSSRLPSHGDHALPPAASSWATATLRRPPFASPADEPRTAVSSRVSSSNTARPRGCRRRSRPGLRCGRLRQCGHGSRGLGEALVF